MGDVQKDNAGIRVYMVHAGGIESEELRDFAYFRVAQNGLYHQYTLDGVFMSRDHPLHPMSRPALEVYLIEVVSDWEEVYDVMRQYGFVDATYACIYVEGELSIEDGVLWSEIEGRKRRVGRLIDPERFQAIRKRMSRMRVADAIVES